MIRCCLTSILLLLAACAATAQETSEMTEARVCRWYHGKQAAVSMRFDDAHPTHLDVAAPMLDEYGLTGTFLVPPGRQGFQDRQPEWVAVAADGHELGNHTMNHRGARTDEEAAYEIGECSRFLRELQTEGSPLRAFQRGGGTTWLQRKPMEYFRAKYDLFRPPPNSLSCSEDYEWFSVERVRQRLAEVRERGGWMQTHFHAVGDGHLKIAPGTLRQLCELFKADDLWSAGIAAIYKYQQERDGTSLITHAEGPDRLVLRLACSTPQRLYDHPLTLEVLLPEGLSADQVAIATPDGELLPSSAFDTPEGPAAQFDVPPADAVFTVEAAGIGAAYEAAHGPGLAAPGPHPYVFFTVADITKLQAKRSAPIASDLWEHVKGVADRLIAQEAPQPNPEANSDVARRQARDAATLAFCYALTAESAYAERAIPAIESALAASTWVDPHHQGDADLVSAEVTCQLALCYDWMHDALPADLRDRVRQAIVERGLEPIFRASDARVWWSVWSKGNWGSVIFGQAGVAAITLLGEEPRAADWVRVCRQKIWRFTEAIGEDGGWGESVSYCIYCWRNATMFMDALARLTEGRDNLFDHPRLRRLPDYFANLLLPDETDFVPFSNYNHGSSPGGFLLRLAAEYRDGHAQRVGAWKRSWDPVGNALAFVWCDPELKATPAAELPTGKHFRTIDWAVLRSGWDDPNGTLFAFKGGDNEWDHYHEDHNSFALWSHGRPLITELGYPHEIWGVRTEAHSTSMVNEHDQLGDARVAGRRGDPRERCEIGDFVNTPWYAHLTGDASMAYDPADVTSFVREVMYLRAEDGLSPEYFVIFDDVAAAAPARIDWTAHTFGDLSLEGNLVSLAQDEAAADIIIARPASFAHEILSKTFDEAGVRKPFETANADTFVKIRPTEPADRTQFLTVLAPRARTESSPFSVAAVEGDNLAGVRVSHGDVVDVALFAINEPEAEAEGIKLAGRTCFVRRTGGRVTAFAVEQGQSLEVDGQVMFGGKGSGQISVAYRSEAVEIAALLYDPVDTLVWSPDRPMRCLVDGKEREFAYDEDGHYVQVSPRGARNVRLELR